MPVVSNDIFVWIPREQTTKYTITIDGTDVTDYVLKSEFTMASTDEIGSFKIVLENSNDNYTNTWNGGEEVKLYLDFRNGDTLRFTGYVEKRSNEYENNFTLTISGRHISGKLIDRNVTYSASSTSIEDILDSIVSQFASDFTYDKTTYPCSTTATVNWDKKPFWECIIDLCNLSGYDCWVDNSGAFHLIEESSVHNSDEAIVWTDNMVSINGLAEDVLDVVNKVVVYGLDSKGLPIIATAENESSQESIGLKERIIVDNKINTAEDAQARADAELNLLQPLSGEAVSGILPSISPSETIWIDCRPQRIRNKYRIKKFTHYFPEERTKCIVTGITNIPHIFRERIQKEISLEPSINPNNMSFSFNFEFNDDSQILSHDGTETNDGFLQLQTGESSGIATSITHTADSSITYFELRVVGENLEDSTFDVCTDGQNFQTGISRNTETEADNPGTSLIVRFNLANPSGATVKIDSFAVLYK